MVVDGPLRVWGLSKFVERLVRPLFHSGTKVCVCVCAEAAGIYRVNGYCKGGRLGREMGHTETGKCVGIIETASPRFVFVQF